MIKRRKPTAEPKNEFVVLLHGILRSHTDMLPLKIYLEKSGYDVINIIYPSRQKSLEELVDFVHEKISDHIARSQTNSSTDKAQGAERTKTYASDDATTSEGEWGRLHFVAHSMGGLITRYYIATRQPKNLGKVVMLGPPNTGSEFADFLKENKILSPLFKKIYGPAGQQLTTKQKHIDGDITYPLGIIAGSRSINPLALFILPGVHDGMVPVERTKIKGMKDHIVMPSTHTFMMFNPKVMQQVKYFLENEKFKA